jgi:hypothetical protein
MTGAVLIGVAVTLTVVYYVVNFLQNRRGG